MRLLAAIVLAIGLGGCTTSGPHRPQDSGHDPRTTAESGRSADPRAEAPATRTTGTDRLPPSSLEDYLSRLQRDGLMDQRNVDDVLLARTQFLKQLDRIPPEFFGYGASTVEGKLYTTTNDSVKEVLTWLDQNNPPGRLGFFTWVNPDQPTQEVSFGTSTQPVTHPGTGTTRPWEDFGPSTSRSIQPPK